MSLDAITVALSVLLGPAGADGPEFTLGKVQNFPNSRPAMPIYHICPDAHVTLLKDGNGLQMYWAERTSYRTRGPTLFQMGQPEPVLGPGPKGAYDNHGAWLSGVFRQGPNKLLGFYHAEDHEFKEMPMSGFRTWKSIALCTSADNGRTWRKHGQIITTDQQKPPRPAFGGAGDFCVVRDEKNSRWVCFFYDTHLSMAVSTDPDAKPGTWKKYYRGDFTEPGLGGKRSTMPAFEWYRGINPSVHGNTYLHKWVMVWHTLPNQSPHPHSIWMSVSEDLVHWGEPKVVVAATGKESFGFATILGSTDQSAGQKALLVYADFTNLAQGARRFVMREITFGPGK